MSSDFLNKRMINLIKANKRERKSDILRKIKFLSTNDRYFFFLMGHCRQLMF